MKEINWSEIQEFYDRGNSYRDIKEIFGLSSATVARAVKNNKLITRNKSDSVKLSRSLRTQIMSQETKDKISASRKRYLRENPDKVPYLLNHYSKGDSYPEKYFSECLSGSSFVKKFRVSTYELDFADLEKKIDLEIDGCQHRLDPRIASHDIKRNNFLVNLGWKVIRVNWSEFQKLNESEKGKIISSILNGSIQSNQIISIFV